jgi:integrase
LLLRAHEEPEENCCLGAWTPVPAIHPKVVSERLGHATVSTTLDTYSHAIPALQEEAAALIAELVFIET